MKIRNKYRYLGAVHDSIPEGWKYILYRFLSDTDKLARYCWIPRFIMNFMYKMAYGNGMVKIKRKWAHNIFVKMFRKYVLIVQIKEKFGTLCLKNSSEFPISDISIEYEKLSTKICQKCGVEDTNRPDKQDAVTTASLKNGYWVMTLCNKCREELETNNKN